MSGLAVLILALGIGASGSIFALADTVLFRPLGLPEPARLVHVYQRRPDVPAMAAPLSLVDYLDYRATTRSFSSLAAHYPTSPMYLVLGDDAVSVTGAVVTASYFDVVALPPTRGRFFTPEEDRVRGRDAVAVVSYGFWQRYFGGQDRALGSTIRVNGRDFTIVGVAPRGFAGVHSRGSLTEVWIPSAMFDVGYRYCDAFTRACTVVELLGRLSPDVDITRAQLELDLFAARSAAAFPATNKDIGFWIAPARGRGYGTVDEDTQQMTLFMAGAGLVLLIVCANIAGLLFARLAARRKEIAMRFALGGTRFRVGRQLLTESVVIALAGAVVGLLVASWGNALLRAMYVQDSAGRPLDFELTMSPVVVLAMVAVSIASAFVFGVVPAVHAMRTDVNSVLKDETATGGARARFRQLLVTTQVALSAMLLIGAGLVVQSGRNLYAGPGFDPGPLLTIRLRPSLVGYSRERSQEYQRRVIEQIIATPGVVGASPAVFPTWIGGGMRVRVRSEGAANGEFDAIGTHGGARYFETLGLPLLEGRDFVAQDDARMSPVVIVNDVLARRLWPAGSATNQTVVLDGQALTVIGVVRDGQYYATGEPRRPQVFFSYWQPRSADAFFNDTRLLVRVAGEAAAMIPTIRRAALAIDADVPISEERPLAEQVRFAYQPVRMAQLVLGSFGVVALVLSAVGLYGMLAFAVTQRTREIGIRMALGAGPRSVASLVLKQSSVMMTVGLLLGLGAAWSASGLLGGLLYGVDGHDAVAFVAGPAVLGVVAVIATLVPTRQATSVSALNVVRPE